jgi:hypothetical protein
MEQLEQIEQLSAQSFEMNFMPNKMGGLGTARNSREPKAVPLEQYILVKILYISKLNTIVPSFRCFQNYRCPWGESIKQQLRRWII